ncbi:MAG: hypothetical protein KTR30_03225 [Saprospiraceae bacterium]|nr:hypothetical protein [Saprospiraceae bacterium]
MQNGKLIDIIRRLSPKEQKRLESFLDCDLFNRNQKVKDLFQIINSQITNNQPLTINPIDISHQLEPDTPFDERRFNNFLSKLLQLVYQFLSIAHFQQQGSWQQAALLHELTKRDAQRHIKGALHKWELVNEKEERRDLQYHLSVANRNDYKDRFELEQNNRRYHPYLQEQSDHLDLAYMIEKLRIACDMQSRNTIIQATYHCHALPELRLLIENNDRYLQHPTINTYWHCLQMLEQQQRTDYKTFRDLLQAHHRCFSKGELRTLYQYGLNYSIKMINSGDSTFYEEIFGLYQVMLEKELLLVGNQLSQWSFKNIVTTSIRLKAFDWTEDFIDQFQHKLAPENQFNALSYNLAALAYAQGDYRSALQHLQHVEFTDSSYHLGAKIIQLKSYYELEEEEAFLSLIAAFRKYLKRNQHISSYRKTANAHFIQLAKELFLLKIKLKLKDKGALRQWRQIRLKLDEKAPIANKDWLEKNVRTFAKQLLS